MNLTIMELYRIAYMLSECTSRGDNTKCYELRVSRAPPDQRGTPLPREFWCEHCKSRERIEALFKEIDGD